MDFLRAIFALGVEHLMQEISAATVTLCRTHLQGILAFSDSWIGEDVDNPATLCSCSRFGWGTWRMICCNASSSVSWPLSDDLQAMPNHAMNEFCFSAMELLKLIRNGLWSIGRMRILSPA